jgi:transcription elongation factor Elf1
MAEDRFRCPYCGKETHLYERYCAHCEHDISKHRDKMEAKDRSQHCFIATAAYGTPFAYEIDVLRDWRDNSLNTNSLGRAFVKFYYKVSPPIARFISKRKKLRKLVRIILKPIVGFLRK